MIWRHLDEDSAKCANQLEERVRVLEASSTRPHKRLIALEEALAKQRAVNKAALAELEKIMGIYKNVLAAFRETL